MTYAVNLKPYLENITSNAEVTMEDFNEAMDTILGHWLSVDSVSEQ